MAELQKHADYRTMCVAICVARIVSPKTGFAQRQVSPKTGFAKDRFRQRQVSPKTENGISDMHNLRVLMTGDYWHPDFQSLIGAASFPLTLQPLKTISAGNDGERGL